MSDRARALQLLEDIGGDVEIEEVRYHLGALGPTELMDAALQGLVTVKTYFSLTDRGRELLASPPPEGSVAALSPVEEPESTSAPGPGGAGDTLPPTGFAACHGRAA